VSKPTKMAMRSATILRDAGVLVDGRCRGISTVQPSPPEQSLSAQVEMGIVIR
jgi:hypothetical protein